MSIEQISKIISMLLSDGCKKIIIKKRPYRM